MGVKVVIDCIYILVIYLALQGIRPTRAYISSSRYLVIYSSLIAPNSLNVTGNSCQNGVSSMKPNCETQDSQATLLVIFRVGRGVGFC